MSVPLRALIVGDLQYNSEMLFGVHQGLTLLGHWPVMIDIRSELGIIVKKAKDVAPHVAIFHMLMWSPLGPNHTYGLLSLCEWLRRTHNTKVLIHDGDARNEARFPHDISTAVDLALCNHTADRSAWHVPTLRWPYFAFVQRETAEPVDEFRCDLAFAGRHGGGIYQARTEFVATLKTRMGDRFRVFPSAEVPHTLYRTPELAASATAVWGHGRPQEEAPGWLDVRVFLLPGAGAVLLHDDAGGLLEPMRHYVPVQRYDADSVLAAVDIAREQGVGIRAEAFRYVQAEHSSVVRIRQALQAVGL